ncbi:hypothetical protein BDR04DRAFT_1110307 [Suillus decipiens]|nr:hypothetical protein BDR04DRAFT_1110307 [Suillus decipiens]
MSASGKTMPPMPANITPSFPKNPEKCRARYSNSPFRQLEGLENITSLCAKLDAHGVPSIDFVYTLSLES